jgi:ADP-ribose pyrophosphatase YjhB (NUDIX family)
MSRKMEDKLDKVFYISAREKEEDWKKKIVTPRVAASGVVESPDRKQILVIKRKYEPHGYAFPGGMSDIGESIEETAIREIKEETNIDAEAVGLLNLISEPGMDPRWHVVVPHLVMRVKEFKEPEGKDDALEAFWMDYNSDELMEDFTEMGKVTLDDYRKWRQKEWKLMTTN